MHQSLDGYCATSDGGLGWIPYSAHLQAYADKIVQTVGSSMYGRVTYELMQSYWPLLLRGSSASKHDREHAAWYDQVEKIVFSTTLVTSEPNTTVIRDNVEDTVKKLKERNGKDLVIFGSPTLARSLMELNLIDEFQFTVSPIILGEGMAFLRSIEDRVNLELLYSEHVEGGIVGLHYRVVR